MLKAERDQAKQDLKETQARLRQLESQVQSRGRAAQGRCRLALPATLFRGSHQLSCGLSRPESPGLRPRHQAGTVSANRHQLGHAPLDRAHRGRPWLRGLPLSQAPFSNGLIWMIDLSIGLGSGKILAVLALDAHHHHLVGGAPLSTTSTASPSRWPIPGRGEAIAEVLKRLIAQMGRPAAYLKDGGSELQKAVDVLEPQGLASPCIDDISHAAANMLKHYYQHHPAFERFLSACGRVSGSSNKPSWRVWRRPPCAPKPAL